LTFKKLKDGRKSGADYICAACPYCQIQFDRVQKMILSQRNTNHPLPSVLYTQLLGLTMGVDRKALGLESNEIPIGGIVELLKKEEELAQEKALAGQKETEKEKASTSR
jgi:heterodisulfide reductase subunit B